MTALNIRVDNRMVMQGLSAAPEVIRRYALAGVALGAGEIAAEAKERAPKSFSTLTNSIIAYQSGELAYEVRAGAAYAPYVEGGSGPAVGKPKYYPNPDNLLAYLMTSPRARGFARFSRSKAKRIAQEQEIANRAQAFAWWIYNHGTKAQPFMRPAAEAKRDACVMHVREQVEKGIGEIFGVGTVRMRR